MATKKIEYSLWLTPTLDHSTLDLVVLSEDIVLCITYIYYSLSLMFLLQKTWDKNMKEFNFISLVIQRQQEEQLLWYSILHFYKMFDINKTIVTNHSNLPAFNGDTVYKPSYMMFITLFKIYFWVILIFCSGLWLALYRFVKIL